MRFLLFLLRYSQIQREFSALLCTALCNAIRFFRPYPQQCPSGITANASCFSSVLLPSSSSSEPRERAVDTSVKTQDRRRPTDRGRAVVALKRLDVVRPLTFSSPQRSLITLSSDALTNQHSPDPNNTARILCFVRAKATENEDAAVGGEFMTDLRGFALSDKWPDSDPGARLWGCRARRGRVPAGCAAACPGTHITWIELNEEAKQVRCSILYSHNLVSMVPRTVAVLGGSYGGASIGTYCSSWLTRVS